MGRGVDRLSRADGVTFFDVSDQGYSSGWGKYECPECGEDEYGYEEYPVRCEECDVAMDYTEDRDYDQDKGREDWDDFKGNLVGALKAKYPSLEDANGWEDETSIILENKFCEIGIAEYIGCASLSIRAKDAGGWYGDDITGLAANWVYRAWPGMIKAIDKEMPWANRLVHLATMSNGESVYRRALASLDNTSRQV